MSEFQFVRRGSRALRAHARTGRPHLNRSRMSPGEQVSLMLPALRVRKAARAQVVAMASTSILAAMLAVLSIVLPQDDVLPVNAALLLVVAAGGLAVGLLDLGIGRSLNVMIQSGAHFRQSASERAAELARTNQMLQRREQERARLFATMSHELRTPLNAILGYSRLLLDNLDGALNQEQRADVGQIHQGGAILLRIVNGTLDLARLDAGGLQTELAPVQAWAVAEEVVALIRPLADEKGLALTSTVSPGLPPILADEERLRHVLVNLVGNAVKFTPSGSVTIRASQHESRLSVTVRDTGIGIEASAHERIFEPFRQAEDSPARSHEGTGLGLAITRRLVHLMGGAMHLESEPGVGSEFTVTLPLALASVPDVHPEPVGGGAERTTDVLLVATESRAARLALALAQHGLTVSVSAPEDWQAAVSTVQPALLLVDVQAPRAGGWRVLRDLSASEVRAGVTSLGLFGGASHAEGDTWDSGAGDERCNVMLAPHLEVLSSTSLEGNLVAHIRRLEPHPQAPVLVIGADGGWRRRLSMEVQRLGLGVHEAPDGESALSVARRIPVGAIIVDLLVGSPGILELLAELQAATGRRTCPILVIMPAGLTPSDQRDLQLAAASWLAADARTLDEAASEIAGAGRADTLEASPVGRI